MYCAPNKGNAKSTMVKGQSAMIKGYCLSYIYTYIYTRYYICKEICAGMRCQYTLSNSGVKKQQYTHGTNQNATPKNQFLRMIRVPKSVIVLQGQKAMHPKSIVEMQNQNSTPHKRQSQGSNNLNATQTSERQDNIFTPQRQLFAEHVDSNKKGENAEPSSSPLRLVFIRCCHPYYICKKASLTSGS